MILDSLADLPRAKRRVIVINVHTDLVAVRAILSAARHVDGQILLLNCDPTDDSRRVFTRLASHCEFDILEPPLRLHGSTLDWVFASLTDERLILLDSDAEIRDGAFVDWMSAKLQHEAAFGAGFLWGPFLIDADWDAPPNAEILYMERPWIPCVEFKVGPVRDAIAAGCTFNASWTPNEFPFAPRLANFLGARWGPPWGVRDKAFSHLPSAAREFLSDKKLDGFRWTREQHYGFRPHMLVRDTGGEVYEYLRRERGMLFAGIPIALGSGEVHHYLGVTRRVLHGKQVLDTAEEDVAEEVIRRLRDVYDYEWVREP